MRERRVLPFIAWFSILLSVIFQVAIAVISGLMIYKSSGGAVEGTAEYALYKNTRFNECVGIVHDTLNCTALQEEYFGRGNDPVPGVSQGGFVMYSRTVNYTARNEDAPDQEYRWCDIVSCFNGFKVLPSSPRQSALGLSSMQLWSMINLTSLIGAWKMRIFANRTNAKELRMGLMDWLTTGYALCSGLFWWATFFRWCTNPTYSQTSSVVQWIEIWNTAIVAKAYAVTPGGSFWKRALVGALWTACGLQVLASCVELGYDWGQFNPLSLDTTQRYDCMESQIQSAPGSSSCSSEVLCSKSWLYSNPGWNFNLLGSASTDPSIFWGIIKVMLLVMLIPSIIFFFLTILFGVVNLCNRPKHGRRGRSKPGIKSKSKYLRGAGLFFAIISGLVVGIMMLVTVPGGWDADSREAVLAYDLECTAVHITISPWRSYLDVQYDRPLRIARMWLNA